MYSPKELYQLNIELEGLLRVLEQRDSADVRGLLADKFAQYSLRMKQLLETSAPQAAPSLPDAEPVACSESTPAILPQEAPRRLETQPTVTIAEAIADNARGIKLDEAISARQASDLNKAFTLNDKYRFRRELFGGSDSDFGHTIGMIVSMNSFEEARDYLLRDLCWDSDNETVDDFLSIVKRHFQA